MNEPQKNLDVWKVVDEQITINKSERVNWKKILGVSLNAYVAGEKVDGLNAQEILTKIRKQHPDLTEEHYKRLKIGVCARVGEMGIAETAKKRKETKPLFRG